MYSLVVPEGPPIGIIAGAVAAVVVVIIVIVIIAVFVMKTCLFVSLNMIGHCPFNHLFSLELKTFHTFTSLTNDIQHNIN
jgi:hypothetical protein